MRAVSLSTVLPLMPFTKGIRHNGSESCQSLADINCVEQRVVATVISEKLKTSLGNKKIDEVWAKATWEGDAMSA